MISTKYRNNNKFIQEIIHGNHEWKLFAGAWNKNPKILLHVIQRIVVMVMSKSEVHLIWYFGTCPNMPCRLFLGFPQLHFSRYIQAQNMHFIYIAWWQSWNAPNSLHHGGCRWLGAKLAPGHQLSLYIFKCDYSVKWVISIYALQPQNKLCSGKVKCNQASNEYHLFSKLSDLWLCNCD